MRDVRRTDVVYLNELPDTIRNVHAVRKVGGLAETRTTDELLTHQPSWFP